MSCYVKRTAGIEVKNRCKAFQKSKDFLKSSRLLVHYDSQKKLTWARDASQYGLGAVLSHQMDDGSEHPIAYASRTLSNAERNYSNLEREALSLVFGVKKFHQYIYGRHFNFLTDHKPLGTLFNEKKATPTMAEARIQRWALTLAAYNYSIEYKPGPEHANADALSRLPLPVSPPTTPLLAETVFAMEFLNSTPVVSVNEIRTGTRRDPILSQVIKFVQQGWLNHNSDEALKPYFTRKDELSVQDGCLLWDNRVVVPPKERARVVEELHEAHPEIWRMKALARSYVWWPKIDTDLEQKVRQCSPCQENRKSRPEAPLHPWEWPTKPWVRLQLDYVGPFLGKMFLIVIDSHSKWMEAFPMNTSTSSATIEKLRMAFATHGLPEIVVTDNGSNFVSKEFEEFLKQNGIRHIRTAPYHPASNGQAERAVQTFKEGMKKMSGGNVETRVSRFLPRYRITPHTSTGVSPAELLLGRKPRSRLDLVYPEIGRKVRQSQVFQKQAHDWHAKERTMQEEEAVYASNFRRGPKWLPEILKESNSPTSFAVQLENGQLLRRHQDHLIQRSCIPLESTANQADPIPASPVAELPELKPEETQAQPTESVQSPTQGIP